jgi:glycosyltransferase involved in cell wall biosynthesis
VNHQTKPRASVVFVDHTAVLAGGERSLVEVASHLSDWDVSAVLGADGELAGEFDRSGIGYEILPAPEWSGARNSDVLTSIVGGLALFRWSRQLRQRFRRDLPDVVVANSLKAGVATWLATQGTPTAFVWAIRDRLSSDYLGTVPRFLLRWLIAHGPTIVVANSEATASTCTADELVVIPPSVKPLVVPASDERGPLTFAVMSRLAAWKGQDVALRAFALAFPDQSEASAELRIIGGPLFGETEYADRVVALVSELDLESRVTFTGHLIDITPALTGVDVVLSPSVIPEPFGRTVVEAMSAGIPVIASDAGGPREIIRHDVDGVLVPIGDHHALADAMRAMADPCRRARLASAGRDRARAFEPQKLAGEWSRTLHRAARQ